MMLAFDGFGPAMSYFIKRAGTLIPVHEGFVNITFIEVEACPDVSANVSVCDATRRAATRLVEEFMVRASEMVRTVTWYQRRGPTCTLDAPNNLSIPVLRNRHHLDACGAHAFEKRFGGSPKRHARQSSGSQSLLFSNHRRRTKSVVKAVSMPMMNGAMP